MIETKRLPERIDHRSLFQSVRDQGQRGTCLAFAVTAAHEARRADFAGRLEDLAEEVLYWGCKQVERDSKSGTTFAAAADALQRWGQPIEALWPYDPQRDDLSPTYSPPPQALNPSTCYRAQLRPIPAELTDIKTALAQGHTPALGVRVSRGFYWTSNGYIELPKSDAELDEGHAVLIVGYDEHDTLIIRNSWGIDWGDQGYGYLPYAYIDRFGGVTWTLEADE